MISHSTPTLLRRLILVGLGIFLSAPLVFALDPSRSLFEYNIQTWNRQNGLPFNRISAIAQTPNGFLWVGTQNGIARFDGIEFVRVAIPNRSGWHSMSVNCLQVSPRGGLWFGLEAGTFGYFDGTNRFDSLNGDWVASLVNVYALQDYADGSLWVASRTGIAGLPGGKTNQLYLNSQLGEIHALYEDREHRLWIGTFEKGLYYWENGKLNPSPNKDLVGANIRAISMDREGRLWVGTSYGLRCYDRDFKRNDALTLYTEVQVLLADSHGAMWIGTSGNGLIRHLNGETSYLRRTNGLPEDYVSSLCEDREGSLWVGTRNGLSQISDLKFPTASTADGPLTEPVHGVCSSRNGGIWCATSAGIYSLKDKSFFCLPDSTNSNPYTKRVFESRDGDLYALSGVREVRIFSNNKLVAIHPNTEWPTSIGEDAHGVVVSVGPQLYRVNRKQMTPFVFKGQAPQMYWIRNLIGCADGSLLVSTVNGAYRIRDGQVEHWGTAEGLPDLDLNCAAQDKEGTIWLGGNAGLSRIRNNKVSVIHLGSIDPLISAIVPDDQGNLWLSCSTGVIQANRSHLNDYADGKTDKLGARVYDGMDALRTIDLTEVESVGCKTADGKIWFPGPLGAVRIDPLHIPFNPLPPPVSIQKILVDGVPSSGTSNIHVRAGNGELAFQYTAPSFIAPQKIHFRYKLEGYDTDWIDAGSQRSALYANLHPGRYSFHVQACNVDGVWSTDGASFAVELPPLFYQTVWFKLAVGWFIVLCIFGIYAWRVRHLHRREKALQAANDLLEDKIRDRTKELAEGRNLLRTLIDHLPDSVFVKDTEGRIIIDNLAHARYLGFESTTQSKGKSDFDCFPREKADEFRAPELAMFESGREYNAEEHLTLKTGEVRWMRTTKVPLRDALGKIVGLAGINRDITERKKWDAEMEALHKQLLETSRHAGMAEVATSVLHNVGNVLNSANVSASIVDEQVRAPSLERLEKVVRLLKENQSGLSQLLSQDNKGNMVVEYLEAILAIMKQERTTIQSEVQALSKNIEHIKKIVSMQQSYAHVAGISEIVNPAELVGDSLRLHEAAYERHHIKVIRDYAEVPKISVDRHKVIQILVNLLANAKYACDGSDPKNRIVRVRICSPGGKRVRIEVSDNGLGIPPENLTRIFSYGFTTRKEGHGFGLHSGALAAKEIGGSLTAHSDGPGKGATFTLDLPLEHKPASPHNADRTEEFVVRED